ncbi:hypothetical protein GCK72_011362 [Caenorhabditis remanei]|uniref:RING-type domain-containing protein n=1 Tax=Caenorhabditis remanei TaxID=31234 RepID=A0A6A5H7D1_CAERE|nr:hypothetical protein GCK72_011362 [Caenorhabditis remanei]KAF1763097.1 hypothetical protein GCK72_011362 [Caenorhabditis remanei]
MLYAVAAPLITIFALKYNDEDTVFVLLYLLFFAPATLEFLTIWRFGVRLRDRSGHEDENGPPESSCIPSQPENTQQFEITVPRGPRRALLEVVVVNEILNSDDVNPDATGLECNVCMLEYSDTVIPRILIGCGHTVCQTCIQKMLEDLKTSDGRPSNLPKNYAVLEMIQKRNM